MQKIKAFISCTILIWLITTNTLHAQVPKDGSLHLEITGSNLAIKAYIPKDNSQFEIEIESDRNRDISRFTDISPHDKQAGERKTQYETAQRDFWYPVVDVEIEPGMEAVCVFTGDTKGTCIFGGPYYTERFPVSKEIVIPANKIENWENTAAHAAYSHALQWVITGNQSHADKGIQILNSWSVLKEIRSGTGNFYFQNTLNAGQYTPICVAAADNTAYQRRLGKLGCYQV